MIVRLYNSCVITCLEYCGIGISRPSEQSKIAQYSMSTIFYPNINCGKNIELSYRKSEASVSQQTTKWLKFSFSRAEETINQILHMTHRRG